MIPYEELYRHFKQPKNWIPNVQAYFDHYKRIPRKLKKQARKIKILPNMQLGEQLWYLQGLKNPNHNTFLIKCITDLYT